MLSADDQELRGTLADIIGSAHKEGCKRHGRRICH